MKEGKYILVLVGPRRGGTIKAEGSINFTYFRNLLFYGIILRKT
jgi:hypothetical protein